MRLNVALPWVCMVIILLSLSCSARAGDAGRPVKERTVANKIQLTAEHIAAVNRERRLTIEHDRLFSTHDQVSQWSQKKPEQLKQVIAFYLGPLEEQWAAEIDALFYTWGSDGGALWPSKFVYPDQKVQRVYTKWWQAGIDPVKVMVAETHKRRRELFFSFRLDGRTSDRQFIASGEGPRKPVKEQHPEWVMHLWTDFWNFAVQEVRDYKVAVVLEAAERYDFDAVQLDFSRIPTLFPPGQQWLHRDKLSLFNIRR